jgi:hypothetical protein
VIDEAVVATNVQKNPRVILGGLCFQLVTYFVLIHGTANTGLEAQESQPRFWTSFKGLHNWTLSDGWRFWVRSSPEHNVRD